MDNGLKLAVAVIAGAVIGGTVVSQGALTGGGASLDEEKVKEIVRDVIKEEPKLILESVNNMQNQEQQAAAEKASEMLKDESIQLALFKNSFSPFIGPADAEHVIVEFFDYNCPACKMQFNELEKFNKAHKDVKIIFKEFPIFGEQSDTNSRIALAVHRIAPEKYLDFHREMMNFEGRADESAAMKIVGDIGLDAKKVAKELADNIDEINETLASNRTVADKLNVRGTPSLIVGDDFVPHAEQADGLAKRLGL